MTAENVVKEMVSLFFKGFVVGFIARMILEKYEEVAYKK